MQCSNIKFQFFFMKVRSFYFIFWCNINDERRLNKKRNTIKYNWIQILYRNNFKFNKRFFYFFFAFQVYYIRRPVAKAFLLKKKEVVLLIHSIICLHFCVKVTLQRRVTFFIFYFSVENFLIFWFLLAICEICIRGRKYDVEEKDIWNAYINHWYVQ